MSASKIDPSAQDSRRASGSRVESMYRENVTAVGGFFARRSTDPQLVADLTSETFARAIASLHTYRGRGSLRAWLIAIARAVYAQHHAQLADGRVAAGRLAGQVTLAEDDLDDLIDRIDAQRAGRRLLQRAADLPELERSATDLVDIAGMAPRDAARALGTSPGAMRYTLRLNDLTAGIPAVNAKLTHLHIPETVIPVRRGCARTPGVPMVAPIPHRADPPGLLPTQSPHRTITLRATRLPAGMHGYIAAERRPDGKVTLAEGFTTTALPACVPPLAS